MKRIRRNDFDRDLKHRIAYFRSFRESDVKKSHLYIIHTLADDHPDAILVHVGTNDILNGANHVDIANNMIIIGKTLPSTKRQ